MQWRFCPQRFEWMRFFLNYFSLTWAHNLHVLNGILASETFWIRHRVARLEFFFSIRVFFQGHWWLTGQQGKGGHHLLFHSTTSTRPQTFKHLFATFHVRRLSHIFNRIACIYQSATRWDLLPYRITIWLIDEVTLSFCLFTWWFDFSFFVTAIWDGKPADSNSHRLSPLYYKRTDLAVLFEEDFSEGALRSELIIVPLVQRFKVAAILSKSYW